MMTDEREKSLATTCSIEIWRMGLSDNRTDLWNSIDQFLLNFGMYKVHLESLLPHIFLGSIHRDSVSAGLGWSPQVCFANQVPVMLLFLVHGPPTLWVALPYAACLWFWHWPPLNYRPHHNPAWATAKSYQRTLAKVEKYALKINLEILPQYSYWKSPQMQIC